MSRLCDHAKLVRSKNAGPFTLTFDVMFDSESEYEAIIRSGVIDVAVISRLYAVAEDQVKLFFHDKAKAIKVSIPRRISSGAPGDTDVYGAQQHGPLAELEVPSNN